jgi:hypothetical protein
VYLVTHYSIYADIAPPPPDPNTNFEGVQHFDSTFDSYDNKMCVYFTPLTRIALLNELFSATEFLAGTPNNVLAFGFNETTRSDFRIFTSDGNRTISRQVLNWIDVYEITTGSQVCR